MKTARVNARAFCAWEGYTIEVRIDRSRRKVKPYDLTFTVEAPDAGDDVEFVSLTAIQINTRLTAETLEDAIVESRGELWGWAHGLKTALENLTWS